MEKVQQYLMAYTPPDQYTFFPLSLSHPIYPYSASSSPPPPAFPLFIWAMPAHKGKLEADSTREHPSAVNVIVTLPAPFIPTLSFILFYSYSQIFSFFAFTFSSQL